MTRLHEPLEMHIHNKMCHEVNEFIIALKIHHMGLDGQNPEQRDKIIEARARRPYYTMDDVIELLTKVHNEMNECTKPFKRY